MLAACAGCTVQNCRPPVPCLPHFVWPGCRAARLQSRSAASCVLSLFAWVPMAMQLLSSSCIGCVSQVSTRAAPCYMLAKIFCTCRAYTFKMTGTSPATLTTGRHGRQRRASALGKTALPCMCTC